MTQATVLNTRPFDLQQQTHDIFIAHGFNVIDFACIEIIAVGDSTEAIKQLNHITASDTLVFTSQYAVRFTFKTLPDFFIPDNTTVIAVGRKTAQVLEQYYSGNIWIPEQQNSTGVVDLLKGLSNCDSIKLISAANGRDSIENYALGANISFEQINVYQRQLPTADKHTLKTISQTNQLFILATSVSTLNNLQNLMQEKWQKLLNHTLVCASSRIAKAAIKQGFKNTLNCQTADPELIANQLQIFNASKHN